MRILLIGNLPYTRIGGIEKYHFNVIKLLLKNYPQAQIDEYSICAALEYDQLPPIRPAIPNVNIILNSCYQNNNYSHKFNIKQYFKRIRHGCEQITKLMAQNQYDLCVCSVFHLAKKIKFNLNKTIFIQHMDVSFYDNSCFTNDKWAKLTLWWIKYFHKCIPALAIANVRKIICYTKYDKIKIKQKFKSTTHAQFFNVPLGYETHLSVPSRNKPAIIAYCGRIDNQQKNISFLIKLMKYLHKLTPYQLVLWGGGEMVKDLSNKPNIVYRGTYSSDTDLRNIYQDVKFAINTSRTEGFSYSLLEAMSLGVPIIVRDTYSNARFLVNGKKNGIIIPKKMKPQIAAAHIASLINKIDYERMQKNCLSFVKNKCNIKLVNQKLLTAFSSVLDHK